VAVDLRGYGDSDKPPRGYDGWTLAGDIAGLVRALGHGDATLVGHSSGGLVCFATAVLHPRAVRSIAVVAAAHPVALKRAILRDRAQRRAWWPEFLRYQVPRYGERMLARDDGFEVEALLRRRSGSDWTDTADFVDTADRMRTAIRIPGVAHCALEYQRWMFRSQWRPDGRRFLAAMAEPIEMAVLAMYGDADPFLTRDAIAGAPHLVPHREIRPIPEAGHYAHQENPTAVTVELLRFVSNRAA
jgi:pimeloyl-ACP methyl ester carboxylesterase